MKKREFTAKTEKRKKILTTNDILEELSDKLVNYITIPNHRIFSDDRRIIDSYLFKNPKTKLIDHKYYLEITKNA